MSVGTAPLAHQVLDVLADAGVGFAASVPCNTLGGLLDAIRDDGRVVHVAVTREEEGVGLCAGAALAGKLPVLLMQNSGLGNCINALLSLTGLYNLPLLLIASLRGGPDETIAAQVPMGRATTPLLGTLGIRFVELRHPDELPHLREIAAYAAEGHLAAAVVQPSFWRTGA